jgi:hypothetical protein
MLGTFELLSSSSFQIHNKNLIKTLPGWKQRPLPVNEERIHILQD